MNTQRTTSRNRTGFPKTKSSVIVPIPAINAQSKSLQINFIRGCHKLIEVELEDGRLLAYPLDPETGLICNYAFDFTAIERGH